MSEKPTHPGAYVLPPAAKPLPVVPGCSIPVEKAAHPAAFSVPAETVQPFMFLSEAPPAEVFSEKEIAAAKAPYVVVSMTTTPARNGTLGKMVDSLHRQARLPDEVRLYLCPGCEAVPGVTCVPSVDRGPITKLLAVLDPSVPDDAIVVTADDDIVYGTEWLQELIAASCKYEGEAVGFAGFYARQLVERNIFERARGSCDVIEGFAGVAYRKSFFKPDVLDVPEHLKFVDDVWISLYLHRAGIPRRVIRSDNPGTTLDLCYSDNSPSGLHNRPGFHENNKRGAMEFLK